MKKKKKTNKINLSEKQKCLIISIIYFIIVFAFSLLFHEKWRDEAQAFLLAKDQSIIGLFKQLSYEGHPPLWYLILMPFAKLGFPYEIQNFISSFFMAAGYYLLLLKSPFKKWQKVLLLFISTSSIYAIVSRSYSLILLAIGLIAVNYKDRHINKMRYVLSMLFLLYTHVLMLGLVVALFIQFGIEELILIHKDKKELKSFIKVFLVSCFFVVALFLTLYGGTKENALLEIEFSNIVVTFLKTSFFMIKILFYRDFVIVILVTILALMIFYYGFKYNKKELLTALVGAFWIVFVFSFIYWPDIQKIYLLLYIFIFYFWITNNKNINNNKIFNIIITILLINNIIVGFSFVYCDLNRPFSNAKITAKYIEKNIENNSVFVPTDPFIATSIIPYTNNKKFWNPSAKEYFTYAIQRKDYIYNYSSYEMLDIIKNHFDNTENVYIIVNPIEVGWLTKDKLETYEAMEKEGNITEIYSAINEPLRKEEIYTIYKIN